MHKASRDVWTSFDRDVRRKERIEEEAPNLRESVVDLSQIDFDQGEEIELTANAEISPHSNLQYFSTREEFEMRLNALMTWNTTTINSTIYGVLTIKHESLGLNTTSFDQQQDATSRFEKFFVKNIRVPRKYTPPTLKKRKRRRADLSNYKKVNGNFDLVCRTPAEEKNPHILEFVLYDCGYRNAQKKIKVFEKYARELKLTIDIELSRYTGQR